MFKGSIYYVLYFANAFFTWDSRRPKMFVLYIVCLEFMKCILSSWWYFFRYFFFQYYVQKLCAGFWTETMPYLCVGTHSAYHPNGDSSSSGILFTKINSNDGWWCWCTRCYRPGFTVFIPVQERSHCSRFGHLFANREVRSMVQYCKTEKPR